MELLITACCVIMYFLICVYIWACFSRDKDIRQNNTKDFQQQIKKSNTKKHSKVAQRAPRKYKKPLK